MELVAAFHRLATTVFAIVLTGTVSVSGSTANHRSQESGPTEIRELVSIQAMGLVPSVWLTLTILSTGEIEEATPAGYRTRASLPKSDMSLISEMIRSPDLDSTITDLPTQLQLKGSKGPWIGLTVFGFERRQVYLAVNDQSEPETVQGLDGRPRDIPRLPKEVRTLVDTVFRLAERHLHVPYFVGLYADEPIDRSTLTSPRDLESWGGPLRLELSSTGGSYGASAQFGLRCINTWFREVLVSRVDLQLYKGTTGANKVLIAESKSPGILRDELALSGETQATVEFDLFNQLLSTKDGTDFGPQQFEDVLNSSPLELVVGVTHYSRYGHPIGGSVQGFVRHKWMSPASTEGE